MLTSYKDIFEVHENSDGHAKWLPRVVATPQTIPKKPGSKPPRKEGAI